MWKLHVPVKSTRLRCGIFDFADLIVAYSISDDGKRNSL
jgi:hypothetical protein